MKETWNVRYKTTEYVYGKQPNEYLVQHLSKAPVGSILLPAEGEGRNAVYAASLDWKVFAFDQSIEGKNKAMLLAKEKNVSIEYVVGDLNQIEYAPEQFNAIALIYAHFPINIKDTYYKAFDTYLAKGGYIIFEAFSKKHIHYNTKDSKLGGPKDVDMLFSIEEIKSYFPNYEIIELYEDDVYLKEGLLHNGKSAVIRFVGRKQYVF